MHARAVIPARPAVRQPPGNQINENVVGWYYEKAFEPKYKKDDMSELYPWLFGEQGLYGAMYESCEYPCEIIDGVCVCPD